MKSVTQYKANVTNGINVTK